MAPEKPFMNTCHSRLGKQGQPTGRGLSQSYLHSLLPISIRGRVLGHVSQPGNVPPLPLFIQPGRILAQVNLWMNNREDKMRFKLSLRIKLSRMEV